MKSPIIQRARALRTHASPPERRLWQFLRMLRSEGHHFRRQAPVEGYFLDFVCYAQRLIIEVDGSHHGTEAQAAHDAKRDSVLQRAGFSVHRFQAIDVMQNLEGVTIAVRQALGPV